MNDIPILIPVKGVSKRCPNKNSKLLPYAVKFLMEQNCMKNAVVISDDSQLISLAQKYGLSTFFEMREDDQDELTSCCKYLQNTKHEAFILLPVTQPFKSKELIQDCILMYEKVKDEIDFITSYTEVTNRECFYINTNGKTPSFLNKQMVRKGESCVTTQMIDGAIYMIKTRFIQQINSADNTNKAFWSGKFKCINNQAPFMDIDSLDDMNKFLFLENFFR